MRYKYYYYGNTIVCVSHYAGKPVRGVAKCAPEDKYDLEFGKRLAMARCDLKVAEKRYQRAVKARQDVRDEYNAWQRRKDKVNGYFKDAYDKVAVALQFVNDLENIVK